MREIIPIIILYTSAIMFTIIFFCLLLIVGVNDYYDTKRMKNCCNESFGVFQSCYYNLPCDIRSCKWNLSYYDYQEYCEVHE